MRQLEIGENFSFGIIPEKHNSKSELNLFWTLIVVLLIVLLVLQYRRLRIAAL